ncbi:MAG: glycosyltransferase family 4 protein, partial [Actinobacteria bacterium]
MRVCIFVANNCTVDSRVLRQAETFSRAGHETIIVAFRRGKVPELELRHGFEIRRVSMVYTWTEGFPRTVGAFGRIRSRATRRDDRSPERRGPAEDGSDRAGPRARLGARLWIRWLLTGRDPSPRSWNGGRSSLGRRLRFAASLLRRGPAKLRRSKRRKKKRRRSTPLGNYVRRRFLLPTRFRQLDRRMAREAIAFKADLYWANDAQTLRPAAAAARATGARVVYDAHEVVWDAPSVSWLKRRAWGFVERKHIRRMDAVFTVCDPIADLMASRYRIARPTVVLNCPRLAETSLTLSMASSPLNAYRRPGEQIVLFHGSLSPWRGLEQLIASVGLLPEEYRLVI